MSIFSRRSSSFSTQRRAPSCRGGASSMLRLAQPAPTRPGMLDGLDAASWLTRAAQVFAPGAVMGAVAIPGPSEFAPSQWLSGH
jgi:hypothetical protein